MTAAELRAVLVRRTGIRWSYNRDLAWLHAEDPDDGEIYTIANLSLDSTGDGKCYGSSRNGAAIVTTINHADAMVELLEACERNAEQFRSFIARHQAAYGTTAHAMGEVLSALAKVHAVEGGG